MSSATITSKGQTTIPKQIRDQLDLRAGQKVTFTLLRDGTVLMRVKDRSILDLAGMLAEKDRKPLPIEKLSR